jgi:rhodanese-related sulfurtransferase
VTRVHTALLFVAAWAGLAAAATGSGSHIETRALIAEIATERDHISAPQLADRIIAGDPALRVFDLRSVTEFTAMHIPTAQHASIETMLRDRLAKDTTIVVYSEGGAHAAQAWVFLRLQGYRDVFVLREGLYEWIARVVEPRLAVDASPEERKEFEAASARSRFFGGIPLAGVPRAEVPVGYWTAGDSRTPGGSQTTPTESTSQGPAARASRQAVAGIRRRGC